MKNKNTVFFIFVLLLLLASCMKTEILNAPETRSIDTVFVKPTKQHIEIIDTIQVDTTDDQRIPIEFDPTVEDWDEEDDIDI